MGRETEMLEFLRCQVEGVIDGFYQTVAQKKGCDVSIVHATIACSEIDSLLGSLLGLGLKGEVYTAEMESRNNRHHTLVMEDEFVVDPFWQQFLKVPNLQIPRVLIARRANLRDALISYGVPSLHHYYWLNAAPRKKNVYTPGSEMSELGISMAELDFLIKEELGLPLQ